MGRIDERFFGSFCGSADECVSLDGVVDCGWDSSTERRDLPELPSLSLLFIGSDVGVAARVCVNCENSNTENGEA